MRDGVARHGLARLADAVVHLGHELVEVQAPLRAKRRRLEEEVHQHGLAAADGTKNIAPLGRRLGAPEQGGEALAPSPVPELLRQPVELLCGAGLCGIGLDHAVGDEAAVGLEDGHRRTG